MRVAVLDLGSNSFHLVVVDVDASGGFVRVCRQKHMLGLGAVVARHGAIPPPHADRAIRTFRSLLAQARVTGADVVLACATAAIRQAANGGALVAAMEAGTGVTIRILSGDDEARLVFGAVVASVPVGDEPVLCLDVGGGSLEVVVGTRHGPDFVASAELGAARLCAELVHHDPPSGRERAAVTERIRTSFRPLVVAAGHLRPTMAVATGGVVRDLARLAAARRTDSVRFLDRLRVSLGDLRRIEAELYDLPAERRARLQGIEPARALVAPVGASMLASALDQWGMDGLVIARWGLREGVLLEHLAGRRSGDDHPSLVA